MNEFSPRPAQEKILAYTGGKMGISAVPGSGKTHTLSALAARIIQSGELADEQEVLIVTLVNSAVDNFSSRIKQFLGMPISFGYRVRTLHGLAHDIVREKPAMVGLENRFSIVDEREADFICKEAATNWLQGHPGELDSYFDREMEENKADWARRQHLPRLVEEIAFAFIRTAKDNRKTPDELRLLLDTAPGPLPLAEMGLAIYANYQRALAYRGAVDFDDLIRLAIDLLEIDPDFLERLHYRWPYILEDEAQDSSKLQEEILRKLAGEGGNWVRVGDPNQAIFETFTTASPQHLKDFISREADKHFDLPQSGRCQQGIIDLANELIHWVNTAHPVPDVRNALTEPFIQPTTPDDPQPNPPEDRQAVKLIARKYAPEAEVEAVVKSIATWLPENTEKTVAVLVPRNVRGAEVIKVLKERNLPCVELLGSTSSTRLATGRLGDIVSALADPQSAPRLAKAYLAWRQDPDKSVPEDLHSEVAKILAKCSHVEDFTSPKNEDDWLAALGTPDDPGKLAELGEFQAVMKRWQSATALPVDQMVLTLSQDLFTSQSDLALVFKLAGILHQLRDDHPGWRLPELNGELALIARNERKFIGFSEDDMGFDPSRHPGKVVVTTMHKAKGLEWDRVYLISVNNYDFPSGDKGDKYIAEKFFIRDNLNLQAEALSQLKAALASGEYDYYVEGGATRDARLDYVRERLRLLYVGITRARRELVITYNTGRDGSQSQALPIAGLLELWNPRAKE